MQIMICWHVFACRTGKERAAASRLGERGLLAFVPCLSRSQRKGPQRLRQPVPAIPGYVLIQLEGPKDAPIPARTLRQILGVEFSSGDKCVQRKIPGKVKPEEMRSFLQYLSDLKDVSSVKQSMKPGDKVRIHYGPMEGKTATIATVKGTRVNLLIELFNAARIVTVKADAIQLENDTTSASKSLHKTANQGTTIRRDGGRSATGGTSRVSGRASVSELG
jgi:transcription antitermination factor NusG